MTGPTMNQTPEQDAVERIALAIDPEAFSAETIQESYYPSARKRLSERQEKARKNARAALAAMPPKVDAPAADADDSDADHTPHAYDSAAPDTCRKCGNVEGHPVHWGMS